MAVYLAGENRIVTSRELEEKIHFQQQTIFAAGRKLKKHGFINTINGPFGGYTLQKPPEEITVQEILAALKDELYISEEASVINKNIAPLGNYIRRLKCIKEELSQKFSFTLADLLDEE